MLGRVIAGKYRLTRYIGAGGMGTIFEGTDLALHRAVAVKLLRPAMTQDAKSVQRFQQEGKAASRLDHPNIVKVYDFGMHNEVQPYLVMEYVVGEPLSAILQSEIKLPVKRALQILQQICQGLEHAHQHKVVHRDLKPGNILITADGNHELVKIVDFGIAKIATEDGTMQNLTGTGEIFGSPLYMSPEQGFGFSLDGRSDIYSLGCILYECLTGSPPHVGDSPLVTVAKHQQEEPLSLREASLGLEFHEDIEHIVAKMLAKQPIDRYSSAAALDFEIANFLDGKAYQSALEAEEVLAGDQFKRDAVATSFRHFQNIRVAETTSLSEPQHTRIFTWAMVALAVIALGVIVCLWLWTTLNVPVTVSAQKHPLGYANAMSDGEGKALSGLSPQQQLWNTLKAYPNACEMEQFRVRELDSPEGGWKLLANLGKLRDLEITSSSFSDSDMEYIRHLPLQFLNIQSTRVTDLGLHVLSGMTTLKVLDLTDVRGVTDAGLKELPLGLVELRCSFDKGINGSGLQYLLRLKELKSLSLDASGIDQKCVPFLCRMNNLQFLDIRDTILLSAQDVRTLRSSLPNCIIRSSQDLAEFNHWIDERYRHSAGR